MKKERRQSYHEMIEAAAKQQKTELSWVSNLYQKRLSELEEQRKNYEQWEQSRDHDSWGRLLPSLSDWRRDHWMLHSVINALNCREGKAIT